MKIIMKLVPVFLGAGLALVIVWSLGRFWQNDEPVIATSEDDILYFDAPRPVATGDMQSLGNSEEENIIIYNSRNQGVVNISTEVIAYNWFFEPIPQRGTTGSGSIINADGHILTNMHVIRNAQRIFVSLADGTTLEGEIVGSDAENDLAIVKIDPAGRTLTPIPLGDSSHLRVGQKVLAIGNPFGLDRTLTVGIVSGLGRPVRTESDLVISNMIQTDASINPGNSGGPLLNARGEMIGINTMIYTPSGGSVGVGFAVPVNKARRVVPDLIRYGAVRRGWIDVIPRQLFPRLVEYAQLPVDNGILVSQVKKGGNAEKAGIKGGNSPIQYGRTTIYLGGDIIVRIDTTEVQTIANFYEALEDNLPGEEVAVDLVQANGRKKTVSVILSERPKDFQWD